MSGLPPVQERTIEVGEHRVNLATAGSGGQTILMLHGGDSRDTWRTWEQLLALSKRYSLLIPDMVGFGLSSRPAETPDHRSQAKILWELLDLLRVKEGKVSLIGASWGGQVALEMALDAAERVDKMVLISSSYDKVQIPRLSRLRRPTLILWAEDDLVAQLKAGYLLRDAIGTSRLEVLDPVAKDPRYEFTAAHRLPAQRGKQILERIERFLEDPKLAEPPELEPELRGMAMKQQGAAKEEREQGGE